MRIKHKNLTKYFINLKGNIINIIVSGTGGQGVNSLYKVLLNLCSKNAIYSKSALYKGGAQRHGTVYATIRLFTGDSQEYQWYSSQISEKSLDLIIGLEPWETLRFQRFFGQQSRIWVNTHMVPLFAERFVRQKSNDPIELIKQLDLPVKMGNYTQKAMEVYNDSRMANYLMAKDAVAAGHLPFSMEDFVAAFIQTIKPIDSIKKQLTEELK
jgi:Pyruvate/2-oxoacid:ferredoxin oxidoreductase gamma subunit